MIFYRFSNNNGEVDFDKLSELLNNQTEVKRICHFVSIWLFINSVLSVGLLTVVIVHQGLPCSRRRFTVH